jgi:hypothetical protein
VQKPDLLARGYRELEHGEFHWIANDVGSGFVLGVDSWSPDQLSLKVEWKHWKKQLHDVYLARQQNGRAYLIKSYPPQSKGDGSSPTQGNRAMQEFFKTIVAEERKVRTVLPVAVGEWRADRKWGLIVYPYLDQSVTLERVYVDQEPRPFVVRERHFLEKEIGRLTRGFVDAGAYPVDAHLDHFLVVREGPETITVLYVDLERIRFDGLARMFMRKRRMIKTVGRLLARLEWFRVSGGRINQASMMRMAHAFFDEEPAGRLNKKLYRAVIRAARRYSNARKFHTRGRYPLRSIPSEGR